VETQNNTTTKLTEVKMSNRGILAREVIKSTIEKNQFAFIAEFRKILQNELDAQLPFEAWVSDIVSYRDHASGQVQFKSENNGNGAIDFKITNKAQDVEIGLQ